MSAAEHLVERVMAECISALSALPWMTPDNALECTEHLAEEAAERAARRAEDIYAEGAGDTMLAREAADPDLHAALEKRRADGATDDDIRWWWNMSPFEQEMFLAQDNLNRLSLFAFLQKAGWEADRAAAEVWKRHAKFGDGEEGGGDDRPLPYELKRRVILFVERWCGAPEAMAARFQAETSFNSLFRKDLRAGNA